VTVLNTNLVAVGLQASSDACPWMKVAFSELGQREVPGARNNPRILDYLRVVRLGKWDETPWCSAFANWCMARAGVPGSGRANARSWLGWGSAMSAGRFGCVTVLRRTSNPALGHVGFWVGERPGEVVLLGGNQSDSVCVKAYPRWRLVGFRWPLVTGALLSWA
jgi:uncharacterized protein (TIGR02594 family)